MIWWKYGKGDQWDGHWNISKYGFVFVFLKFLKHFNNFFFKKKLIFLYTKMVGIIKAKKKKKKKLII